MDLTVDDILSALAEDPSAASAMGEEAMLLLAAEVRRLRGEGACAEPPVASTITWTPKMHECCKRPSVMLVGEPAS